MRTQLKRVSVMLPVALLVASLLFLAWRVFRSSELTDDGRTPTDARSMSPDGDWRLARSGSERGVHWNMYLADAKPSGTCASIELVPEPTENVARVSAVMHHGREATCVTDPQQSAAAVGPIALVRTLQADAARYNIVAVIATDNVAELVIRSDDQTPITVPLVDRTFVVIYDRATALQSITVVERGGRAISRCKVVLIAPPSGGLDLRCRPAFS